MKRIRDIKGASALLKRDSAMLQNPHLMRIEYDRGEYEEVVRLYSRIKSTSTAANISIITKVRGKANEIIQEMCKRLTGILLGPQPLYKIYEIQRYSRILGDIEAPVDHIKILEKCFDSQLKLFLQYFHNIERLCQQSLEKIIIGDSVPTSFQSDNTKLKSQDRANLTFKKSDHQFLGAATSDIFQKASLRFDDDFNNDECNSNDTQRDR